MANKITEFLKSIPAPSVYFVFPGKKDKKDEKESSKKQIMIPMEPALVVDTSALIDGRIADILETGFMSGTFVVPSFVVKELQQVADSKDSQKRKRGRRGLDILNEIKKSKYTKFKVVRMSLEHDSVDEGVLMLARRLKGRVITTDFNLNKVGKVTGVPILNVNELSNMVKTILLPGETFDLTILKEGKEKTQGVGYLPDGTMVVVQDAVNLIGDTVNVVVERSLQTNAGRMIFAKLVA
jgi:uncharacterized protein YacL